MSAAPVPRPDQPARPSTTRTADPSTTTTTNDPLPGALQGHVVTLLLELERARLTLRQHRIAVAILTRCYRHTPSPENWHEAGAGGNPWQGWMRLDEGGSQSKLAEALRETPGNLSTALSELEGLGILRRGEGDAFSYACITPSSSWSPVAFDLEAATARHARAGAGAPVGNRNAVGAGRPPSTNPKASRPLLTEADVRGELCDDEPDTPAVLAQMWRFIDHFQTHEAQAFRREWLPELRELLSTPGWTGALLVGMLDEQRRLHAPTNPWGYLVSTLSKRPRLHTVPKGEVYHHAEDSAHAASRDAAAVAPARTSAARRADQRGTRAPGAGDSSEFDKFGGRKPRERRDGERAAAGAV